MENAIDSREHKGQLIAAKRMLVKKDDATWLVPSQSGRGTYQVDLKLGSCSCPDFESRQLKCKHIIAVEITIAREHSARLQEMATEAINLLYGRLPQPVEVARRALLPGESEEPKIMNGTLVEEIFKEAD